MAFAAARMIMPKDKSRKTSEDIFNSLHKNKSIGGTSTPTFLSKYEQSKYDAKPPSSRGHIKHIKGSKGKKTKLNRMEMYDLIVNIDLNDWQLTSEQVNEFKEVFKLFDKDEDGVLTFSELNIVMKSLGQRPKEEELLKMVRDVSEDPIYDTIEFNEFLQMMSKQQKYGLDEESIKEAFKIFDKDNDGYISVDELRNIMQSLGEKMAQPELDEMVQVADLDDDGLINYEDFVHVLCSEGKSNSGKKRMKMKKTF
ncbi:uncharacterized protein [Lepeophtheirus salmonis]|nr:calmodulin-like [Lepeophtheirus salmonis]XP_040578233.1 calmodulin-like [Lepeophtheirus salmonis]XP_040578234.1 calmodulin-like [Lepeophtheirus salmonis]